MKKALSLLVVFAMVCCPMIASAAAGDGVATPPTENCIYSGDTVSVEAGATTYFEIGTEGMIGTYDFVVEGTGDFDVAVCTEGSGEFPYAEGTPVSATEGKVETEITSYESTYGYAAFSITNNTDAAVEYTVTVVFPVGTQGNPEAVTLAVDGSAEVTVAAGAQYYVALTLPMMNTEYDLTVSGATGFGVLSGWGMPTPDTAGSVTLTVSATMWGGGVASVSISNNTETEQTYTLSLANKPAGTSAANPLVIEENGDIASEVAEGAEGMFYQYTATEAGTVTITMNDEAGWAYSIDGGYIINYCDDDPVLATQKIEVEADEVISIIIMTYDPMAYRPAGTVNWNLTFEAAPEEPDHTGHNDILVSHVNAYTYGLYAAMVITGEGQNHTKAYETADCKWWVAIKVDNVDGVYTVTAIEGNGADKSIVASADGFLLYVFADDAANITAANSIQVGDVLLNADFDWNTDTANETPIGTLCFGTASTEPDPDPDPTPDPEPDPDPDPEPVEDPVISLGASYTYDGTLYTASWHAISTEPNTRLTDGAKADPFYYDVTYVGFNTPNGEIVNFVIDLNSAYNVSKFCVYAHSGIDGISYPENMTVAVSSDNENWTEINAEYTVVTTATNDKWSNAVTLAELSVTATEAIEAQYVKISLDAKGNFIVIDEIEVHGTAADSEPVEKQEGYDENATLGALAEGTADYDLDDNYVYTIFSLEPTEIGKYTITVADGLVGIVSYNGMWVTIDPSADTVSANSVEWECTSVGQSIWVAVSADADPASITVEAEEITIVTVPETDYENTVTPEEFTYDGNLEDLEYVDTFDETDDVAVLGEDGFYHLNTVDGPILYVCLNDSILSLIDANSYGQLTYVEYDEEGNAVSKVNYATAFEAYAACAYTDENNSVFYPLTADLMVMFQNVGANNGWYGENGFIGGDLADAWMFACYYAVESDVLEGDVDGDGVVDMFDYGIVRSIYFEIEGFDLEAYPAADVDGDGVVDMFDYLIVKTAYFNS